MLQSKTQIRACFVLLTYVSLAHKHESYILSFFFMFKSIFLQFIPGITSWKFYEAKKHSEIEGTGFPVPESTEKREKVNLESLDHFIDFITSTHVIK